MSANSFLCDIKSDTKHITAPTARNAANHVGGVSSEAAKTPQSMERKNGGNKTENRLMGEILTEAEVKEKSVRKL